VLTALLGPFSEFLITELALASHSIPSFTLSSPSLLSEVLELHPPSAIIVDGSILPHVLELIYELKESKHHFVIVVGETDDQVLSKASEYIKAGRWSDIETQGKAATPITSPAPGDCHPFLRLQSCSPILGSGPDDVFTVSFYRDTNNEVQAACLTHQNITAGVTAIRALLPASAPLSALDTVISAHSLGTAFGRAITYTALYEGTSFATLESTKHFEMRLGMTYLIGFHLSHTYVGLCCRFVVSH
jgi:long-chain acyl-CoA synthetase